MIQQQAKEDNYGAKQTMPCIIMKEKLKNLTK